MHSYSHINLSQRLYTSKLFMNHLMHISHKNGKSFLKITSSNLACFTQIFVCQARTKARGGTDKQRWSQETKTQGDSEGLWSRRRTWQRWRRGLGGPGQSRWNHLGGRLRRMSEVEPERQLTKVEPERRGSLVEPEVWPTMVEVKEHLAKVDQMGWRAEVESVDQRLEVELRYPQILGPELGWWSPHLWHRQWRGTHTLPAPTYLVKFPWGPSTGRHAFDLCLRLVLKNTQSKWSGYWVRHARSKKSLVWSSREQSPCSSRRWRTTGKFRIIL